MWHRKGPCSASGKVTHFPRIARAAREKFFLANEEKCIALRVSLHPKRTDTFRYDRMNLRPRRGPIAGWFMNTHENTIVVMPFGVILFGITTEAV